MRRKQLIPMVGVCVLFAAPFVFASFGVTLQGAWPESWPDELDALRLHSWTLTFRSSSMIHEIPFYSREDFEAAWPHILSLKSENAPLILLASPARMRGEEARAGVRIHAPFTPINRRYNYLHCVRPPFVTAPLTTSPRAILSQAIAEASSPAESESFNPALPDDIRLAPHGLPEFVVFEDEKWLPFDHATAKASLSMREYIQRSTAAKRARTDIELIVDGDIIDLNRIQIPPDTPIVDKRFEQKE